MGDTSKEAKQRWNSSHYAQVKIAVAPELAAAFKAKCASEGVSMASEISGFMRSETCGIGKRTSHAPSAPIYETRQKRRKAVSKMMLMLEDIKTAEQRYLENIPVNLQGSCLHEAAEETVDVLADVLDRLSEAY